MKYRGGVRCPFVFLRGPSHTERNLRRRGKSAGFYPSTGETVFIILVWQNVSFTKKIKNF